MSVRVGFAAATRPAAEEAVKWPVGGGGLRAEIPTASFEAFLRELVHAALEMQDPYQREPQGLCMPTPGRQDGP